MQPRMDRFPETAARAARDARLAPALSRLADGFQAKRAKALAGLKDAGSWRAAATEARARSVADLPGMLRRYEARARENGIRVHWARDASEANARVTAILRKAGARSCLKSKSMVSEEIGLNAALEKAGITPIETDLGEYILQLRNEPPSHIVAPAFHLSEAEVAETFRGAHDGLPAERKLDRRALVDEARAILRGRFLETSAGITGANLLVAETGTAMLVTNEGNADLIRALCDTHIIVTGIEKVVETMGDAFAVARMLGRSATGQALTAYTSFPGGPHQGGPTEVHVVLVDHGRAALTGTPAEDVLRCIRCGACLNHCPVYAAIGGHAYGWVYPGPIGAALNPGLTGIGSARHLAEATSSCGRCEEVCPVGIPLTRIFRHWRARAFAARLTDRRVRWALRFWAFSARRPALYRLASRIANGWLRRAGRNGRIERFPLADGWTGTRSLPAPTGPSFLDQLERQRRAEPR